MLNASRAETAFLKKFKFSHDRHNCLYGFIQHLLVFDLTEIFYFLLPVIVRSFHSTSMEDLILSSGLVEVFLSHWEQHSVLYACLVMDKVYSTSSVFSMCQTSSNS